MSQLPARLGGLVGRIIRTAASDARMARRRVESGQAVLVVDQLPPDPRLGAGYPRAFALVSELVELGCRVAFYATDAARHEIAAMQDAFGGKVHFFPPLGAKGFQRTLRKHGAGFDVLLVSRPGPMTLYADGGWRPPAPRRPLVVYDAEAVLSPREERRRALFGDPAAAGTAQRELATELAPVRAADAVSAVGPHDAAVLAAATGKPVVVLSHLVDARPATPPFAARADLLFVGRMTGRPDQSPNVDSVVWFATEVMPVLDRLIGTGWTLHLVGLQDAPAIAALPSARIVSHGTVDDLAPVYDRSRLFVAPTRYASGLPLKLVEVMGQGLPSVATPLLAEQLGVGGDVLPTGTFPDEFARECARLYTDEAAWAAVRQAALDHARRHYSRAAFRASVEEVLALAGAAAEPAAR